MNGRQALNLKIGDHVIRDGDLTGRVVNKERMFIAIRWDDGTVTSTHRYSMENINRPGAVVESSKTRGGRYERNEDDPQLMQQWLNKPGGWRQRRREVIDALQAGEDYARIAEKVGVSLQYVDQMALNEGLRKDRRRRGPRPPTERNVAIIAALKEGGTYSEIAKQHGLSYQRIQQIAKKYGIIRKRKQQDRGA